MLTRMLFAVSTLFIVLQLGQLANGDEKSSRWIKYFAGSWEREDKTWTTDEGWKEESVEWSCELVAGGTTCISKGGGNWGDFVTVLGIDGHSGQFFEYGAAANGNKWRIMFETIESEKLTGKLVAAIGEGVKGDGELEIVRKSEDAYEASWHLKLDNGKEMKGSAKNKRKR